MIFVGAAAAGLVFGAADQYLGTTHSMDALGVWTVSVSLMSAPWLLLPFVFGCTQIRPRRAMLVGLVATLAGLVGYFAMTVSPIEGVALSRAPGAALSLLRSNAGLENPVILGGLITGPLFGLLGQRWRVSRSWLGPALVAGAFVLEPLARLVEGRLLGPGWIWGGEVTLGALLVGGFLVVGAARPRSQPSA